MMRHALNSVAVAAPAWLRQVAPPEWYGRYSERVEEYRLPRKKQERQALAEAIGAEGVYLLTSIYESDSHQWLRELPAVELLRRAWVHQFYYMFPQPATIEDLDLSPRRGLQRAEVLQLAQSEWVGRHLNMLVLGATRAGKSFLATALGRAACEADYKVRYARLSRLLQALALAQAGPRPAAHPR